MASITEIRDGVVTRGRSALGEATKPVYAWIGAGDIAVQQVASRLKELRGTSPAAVRGAVEGYGAIALNGYADLTRRGERVVGTIRNRNAEKPAVQEDPAPVAAPTKPRKATSTARRSTSATTRKATGSTTRRRPTAK
jgi:hypothetical protein